MVGEYQESVTVHPELVKLGDPVTISVTSGREYLPLTLELTERYLEQEFTVGDGVRVSWTDSAPIKTGSATCTPRSTGNYLIRLGELTRAFGVVDDQTTICSFTIPFASSDYPMGNQLDFYHPEIHSRPIPVDYAVHVTDERSLSPTWDVHKNLRGFQMVYGDGVFPILNQGSMKALAGDFELSEQDGASSGDAVRILLKMWQSLGYQEPGTVDLGNLKWDHKALSYGNCSRESVDCSRFGSIASTAERSPTKQTNIEQDVTWTFNRDLDLVEFRTSFGHPDAGSINFCPRVEAAETEDMQSKLETRLHPSGTIGPHFLYITLDGDAPGLVEANRTAINLLAEMPRTRSLVFGRKQAIAPLMRDIAQHIKKT
ncbi:MAG: hypothetical protein HOH43_25185 [Candidatus Latescibacteria bacterium]|nr:hypothetical protein [Candidatus Latescibacterota bacterium]